MQIPRRAPRRRTMLLVGFFSLAALLVVATYGGAAGIKPGPPRNDPKIPQNDYKNPASHGEIYSNNLASDCWSHHQSEGMRDTVIIYPVFPKQVALNKPIDLPVQIINPWKQELRDISMDVLLTGPQLVAVDAGKASSSGQAADVHREATGILGYTPDMPQRPSPDRPPFTYPYNATVPLTVPLGAKRLIATVELVPEHVAAQGDGWAVLWHPISPTETAGHDAFKNGQYFSQNGTAGSSYYTDERFTLHRNLSIPISGGPGLFYLWHTDGQAGGAAKTHFYLNATVVMQGASTGTSYSIPMPDGPAQVIKKTSDGGKPLTVNIKVIPFAKGMQTMEIRVRVNAHYKHADGNTPDDDHFTRIANLSKSEDYITSSSFIAQRGLVIGDAAIASEYTLATATADTNPWQLVVGETSGFAAAALLVPSLLLGGTYGKGSRRFFNTVLGGAKRRVMFHNLMSLGLSLVAFGHILLFTYEVRYTILMGVLWGGLGALSLLLLGLTGYYQVPLIQRHGYKWWRYVHLVTGLLVVFFITYHMVADGTDFNFIKQELPKWINNLNLAQK